MKKYLVIVFCSLFSVQLTFCQTSQDLKDFISEKITANRPLANYDNGVFFQNIIKKDAEVIAGQTISDVEFQNEFIYAHDIFSDDRKIWHINVSQIIDIRGITKVSTTFSSGDLKYYTITVYLSGRFLAKMYTSSRLGQPEWKNIEKMEILISDNKEAALQIKKGIIHLCEINGIKVTDGDLF